MKTKLTVVDIMCAQLLGEQFVYGSSIYTISEVLLTESGQVILKTDNGLTINKKYVDMVTQIYSK